MRTSSKLTEQTLKVPVEELDPTHTHTHTGGISAKPRQTARPQGDLDKQIENLKNWSFKKTLVTLYN